MAKNSLFEHFENHRLTLALDEQYASLLTKDSADKLEKTLSSLLGKITLNILVKKPTEPTLAQQQQQQAQAKKQQQQQQFLENKGVQKLQQVFSAQVDIDTIGDKNV